MYLFFIVTDGRRHIHRFSAECWQKYSIIYACHSIETNLLNDLQTGLFWMVFWKSVRTYKNVDIFENHFHHSFKPISAKYGMFVITASLMPHFGVELHKISMPPDAGCPDHTASDWSKVFCTSSEQFQGGASTTKSDFPCIYSIFTIKNLLY